jgi:hypothetical protein
MTFTPQKIRGQKQKYIYLHQIYIQNEGIIIKKHHYLNQPPPFYERDEIETIFLLFFLLTTY